ncbi:MAG: hypothetical protein M3N97_07210 [Pseudomonadota bacterium]|nr:hypothetical protein [Pseudomonadota bacterium]
MIKALNGMHPLMFLIVATTLEVSGDVVVRMGLYNHVGLARTGLFLVGAALLFGYGSFLNLAPLEFGRVVGLYIATLFVIWQIINFFAFRTQPTLPILVGGALVITGGAIITFWKPA